jgi:hypothetical protein
MKIEIDLNDILGDENGAETLQESVRRQVIDTLVRTTKAGVDATIKQQVAATIKETLERELIEKMPGIINDVLTSEYTPVGRYGDAGKPTTFRAELVKSISEQMTYKAARFDSDKNAFTRAVDSLVESEVATFKKEFNSHVTAKFVADAMDYAAAEMAKRLGVAKV